MNELLTFLHCALIGVMCGFLYDALYFIRSLYRKRWLRILCDFLFCMEFAVLYVFFAVILGFEALRFYHLLGCVLGFFLYLKSFHKIVAFFSEKLYNRTVQKNKGNTHHGRRGKRTKTG